MKNLAIFLLGCVFGAFVLGAVLFLRKIGAGFDSWGQTQVCSDTEVRQSIRDSGIALPPDAWDLFHAINGFQPQDRRIWISLTVPRDQVWTVVEKSIHMKREDFSAGLPEDLTDRVPMGKSQDLDTSLWAPKGIKNPLHYSRREGQSYREDWVIDEDAGRIFIAGRSMPNQALHPTRDNAARFALRSSPFHPRG